MILNEIKLASVCAALCVSAAVTAHADEFDLASQRGEVQHYNRVSGVKLDHDTPVVNPTPHDISYSGETIDVSAGFNIKDRSGTLADALGFIPAAKGKGIKLDICHGVKQAAKAGVRPVSGAYRLDITPRGVTVTGFDDAGAFYALQTLRQLLEYSPGTLPACTVNDWPDLPARGVVEGFYGTPWSHHARLSQLEMYGRNKLNTYIYGPKDDPYHSSPNWRLPYPEAQADSIRQLAEAARHARVNFVWAIHPGKDIRWDKADYDSLVNKFNAMYDLGVRGFALFFDDIEGIGADPRRQAALVNDLTRDFVVPKGDVTPIMICPTDYSQLWANPNEWGTLAVYGRELAKDVHVFWTGAAVCSDLTPETLEFVDSRIQRPAMYWWNFPVSDYCSNLILQGPVYGLDNTLTAEQIAGLMSNPMEHAEASKLALYGVADYSWNIPAYNALDNWERSLAIQMPGAPEAYRTFAIHSADTENGYRRDESWETEVFEYNSYTPEQFDALRDEFARIVAAPDAIRDHGGNAGLTAELDPWLTQFAELGRRGLRTLDLIKTHENGTNDAFWAGYVANLMDDSTRVAYEAHKSGILKLQPFYEAAMEGMITERYNDIAGSAPSIYTGIGTYANLRGPVQRRLMVDNDTTTFYTTTRRQVPGDWLGLDLGMVRPVDDIQILQGRNSVDDTDFFDLCILEASADGERWTALSDTLRNVYDIRYRSDEPVMAQYVRIRRLDDTDRTNWLSVREFRVNPATEARIGLNIAAEGISTDKLMAAFDGNPNSSVDLDSASVSLDRADGADTLIALLGTGDNALSVTQLDNEGRAISSDLVSSPYAAIDLRPETRRITVAGSATIHQLIQRAR